MDRKSELRNKAVLLIEFIALAWWGAAIWRKMNLARMYRANVLGAPGGCGSEASITIVPAR